MLQDALEHHRQSPPVSMTPIAVMTTRVMPVWPVTISISPVTNRRISATHRLAVTVAVPGRVGAEVRKALRE
jgi:hypothetical protein